MESLLVQSYNAPNRLLFKTTLQPLQDACISYLNSLLAGGAVYKVRYLLLSLVASASSLCLSELVRDLADARGALGRL